MQDVDTDCDLRRFQIHLRQQHMGLQRGPGVPRGAPPSPPSSTNALTVKKLRQGEGRGEEGGGRGWRMEQNY